MNLIELFRHETDVAAIPAGQAVFRAGEPGNVMYVLISGTADVMVGDVVVERAEPGALLGEMALVEHAPRTATVTAVRDCVLVPIDAARFHFLVQQTPYFATHVMKVMAERLRKMDLRLLEAQAKKPG
ncbi:cAMP-binding protein [Sulfuriferula multivorans]|uniref:cAMP-binding protein n=1 Tax=Sulfuriferula multivorans TaxID=1559896 RepID=A0A401J9S0_9PROT|nr:cyclic nucleotide-binding domain-containing protein [Sulfuriferula multivorans]GBL44402.1 cAMP-binding protein [Sulfuriferula multivorans]